MSSALAKPAGEENLGLLGALGSPRPTGAKVVLVMTSSQARSQEIQRDLTNGVYVHNIRE
jgi:hypothetical protein